MRRFVAVLMGVGLALPSIRAAGHDIPNARVDRSIQVSLEPGRVRVDYELSLSELTLVQELRQLLGDLPGTDRRSWFDAYGRETGPMNARGVLVSVDGSEVDLKMVGFDLTVEEHPRYRFHFAAEVPAIGKLTVNDTNFAGSEGTSRLAIRGVGVALRGDSLPAEVGLIPIRPVWELSPAEERRTKRVTVDYSPAEGPSPVPATTPVVSQAPPATDPLSRLLDEPGRVGWPALLLMAFVLGAGHAIQPGHGKTMVAASSIGPGRGPWRGAALGLATAMVHLSSVALIAGLAWITRTSRLGDWNLAIVRFAGFAIAAIGAWRLGRHLAGLGEGQAGHSRDGRRGGILAIALAGGIVPCGDAVALVILSTALGRLATGLTLLAAFSLGMATVLVSVGALAGRLVTTGPWDRRLGILGGVILMAIGLAMLGR